MCGRATASRIGLGSPWCCSGCSQRSAAWRSLAGRHRRLGRAGADALIVGGYAVTLPQFDVPSLPGGHPSALDVSLPRERAADVHRGRPVPRVNAYLRDVPIDVIEQIDRPGAASTSPVDRPAPRAAPEAALLDDHDDRQGAVDLVGRAPG